MNISVMIILGISLIVLILVMYLNNEKNRVLYECYIKMSFKGLASASTCKGKGDPECSKCYYHKMYLKENSS